jgi:sulfate adenylyltransferase subunit 1 (EFTu-like GTPase family)
MVTGASTADLAVILLDARAGLLEQSRRHTVIAATLGIPRVVLAVNKMDLVGWSESRYDELAGEFACFADPLGFAAVTPIPLSALHGDNVVEPSAASAWYAGPTLLGHLEAAPADGADALAVTDAGGDGATRETTGARLPVQWVIRPRPGSDDGDRRYAGTLAGGRLRCGGEVVVLPSGRRTTVRAIEVADGSLEEAEARAAIAVRLSDDLDVGRGDLIAAAEAAPPPTRELRATVCWCAERPLRPRDRLLVRHTTRTTKALVAELVDRLDVTTLGRDPLPEALAMNDLGTVRLQLASPLAVDAYAANRTTGSIVLVDEATNDTIGAGLLQA